MCHVPGWVNWKHWIQLGPFPSPHSLCDSSHNLCDFPCTLQHNSKTSLMEAQGSQRELSKRQEVEAASFLKPGPGHPHSVTSITFCWSKQPQTFLSFREGGINPTSNGRGSQNFKPTCLPHCKTG